MYAQYNSLYPSSPPFLLFTVSVTVHCSVLVIHDSELILKSYTVNNDWLASVSWYRQPVLIILWTSALVPWPIGPLLHYPELCHNRIGFAIHTQWHGSIRVHVLFMYCILVFLMTQMLSLCGQLIVFNNSVVDLWFLVWFLGVSPNDLQCIHCWWAFRLYPFCTQISKLIITCRHLWI